jgi:type II secretory pathway component PulM
MYDDEQRKRSNDRYQASRSDFSGSRLLAKWKAMEPSHKYIVAGLLIVVIILIGVAIYGVPGA